MKKVLLSLTLFMASFFFITLDKVSAATINIDISSDVMSSVNDYFFTFREQIKEIAETNNSYYVITRIASNNSNYFAYLFSSLDNYSIYYNYQAKIVLELKNFDRYDFKDNNLSFQGNYSSSALPVFSKSDSSIGMYPIDSNFDLYYSVSDSITITYNDFTYSVTSGITFPTLYKIYLDGNPIPDDPFEEDKEILNNFYTTIFTKISDLAINFANNYIFLLIFGIFILIFVFELIWRRFI